MPAVRERAVGGIDVVDQFQKIGTEVMRAASF